MPKPPKPAQAAAAAAVSPAASAAAKASAPSPAPAVAEARPVPSSLAVDTSDSALEKLLLGKSTVTPTPKAAPADGDDNASIEADVDDKEESPESRVENQEPEGDDDAAPSGEEAGEETATDDDEPTSHQRVKFTPEQQEVFDRAQAEQRAKTREAKEAADKLQQEIDRLTADLTAARETPPPAPAPTKENPLAHVLTEADLEKEIATVREWRRWCQLHPDGGEAGPADKPVEISAQQVREYLADSESILLDAVPARRAFIQRQAAAKQDAVTVYPWLKNPHAEQTVRLKALQRQAPAMAGLIPNWELILADHIANSQARADTAAKASKAAAPVARPSTTPRAPASPAGARRAPHVAGADPRGTEATETLRKTGRDPGDAALKSILRL